MLLKKYHLQYCFRDRKQNISATLLYTLMVEGRVGIIKVYRLKEVDKQKRKFKHDTNNQRLVKRILCHTRSSAVRKYENGIAAVALC